MSFRISDFATRIDLGPRQGGRMRKDGRADDALRKVTITPGWARHAEGSALIDVGETRVLCTVSIEERVPQWMRGKGGGWVTAEYGMLPRATSTRTPRESGRGGASGRTHEIQRLIGRSLRAVTDLGALGERTLWVDCDVLQADGGTRTASITGAYVALVLALRSLQKRGLMGAQLPLTDFVAATSIGRVGGQLLLDLDYEEDSSAEVDMNVVRTGSGRFVELQGTAEETPFGDDDLLSMLSLADKGVQELIALQKSVLGEVVLRPGRSSAARS